MALSWITPQWPAPANIRAVVTTRQGGVSQPPHDSFNLSSTVGDATASVQANRQRLVTDCGLPAEPLWLRQVHGRQIIPAHAPYPAMPPAGPSPGAQPGLQPGGQSSMHPGFSSGLNPGIYPGLHQGLQPSPQSEQGHAAPEADAVWTDRPNTPCAVLTADCLPVLLCDRAGTRVAAVHAGWRGLAAGVIERAVGGLCLDSAADVIAWLGPAIGPDAFEVGQEVRDQFLIMDAGASSAFRPSPNGRWLADLYVLARRRLRGLGVREIHGGGLCTHTDTERFFSYRRDGRTGRMATVIWMHQQP